jgi:DNA repair protein RadC
VGRPADVAALLRERLETEPVEVCLVVLLTTKHRVIGIHELSCGTLDSCPGHPRDVFKTALLANAAGVIVGHNHPSGDPTPSPDDVTLCARLRQAEACLGSICSISSSSATASTTRSRRWDDEGRHLRPRQHARSGT